MSWFIKLLKCILCVEDEEREVSRHWRQYEYQRLSSADSYSRTSPTYSTLKSQSTFANTSTSSEIPNKWYENSVSLRSTQNRESIQSNSVPSRNVADKSCTMAMDSCNKVPVASSQFNHPSSVKPPLAMTKAKLSEVPLKPNHIISSSSTDVLETNKSNQVLNNVSKQSSSGNVSASSQRSQPSSDLRSHVHSFKPTSVTTKSTPHPVSKNSIQYAYKPKDSLSPKPPPISSQPTLSPFSSSSTNPQKKNDYVWEKSASTTYVFPVDIKRLIEKDIVPGVLRMPLSPTTYKDYFHTLLYAEDCHLEKWEGFEMKNVTLELHDSAIYTRKKNSRSYNASVDKDEKVFVAFDIDKVLERQSEYSEKRERRRERRPFLLSRDFISVKPTGSRIKPFQGVIHRVVKSSLVLAEFGEGFHSQHDIECEYDVKFSFNRVCLKRAHYAITAAPETLHRTFLFPDFAPKQELPSTDLFGNYSYKKEVFAIRQILRLHGTPPYLVEGPVSVDKGDLSRTAMVIIGAVIQICRKSPSNRVLLCAPLNNTCDVLMRALKKRMDESDMFRANAAFREIDGVPSDILPSCLYEEEMDCFACPSLAELKKYKVISSTFMSSFRLRNEGMVAGHFSHIFLVDASSATEPETMIPLASLANSETIVVVTGAPRNRSGWVRSWIARENGLRISYFERLRSSELYKNEDPKVITQLEDKPQNFNEISKSVSAFLDLISLLYRRL